MILQEVIAQQVKILRDTVVVSQVVAEGLVLETVNETLRAIREEALGKIDILRVEREVTHRIPSLKKDKGW